MILRRVIEHVKAQNWTAVVLDFFIVVFGVFIGLQVNNWNSERADGERAREYLSRIRADLATDVTTLRRQSEFWGVVAEKGYAAIHYAETGDLDGASEWEVLRTFLDASQAWQYTFIDTTYAELRSAGELRLISDNDLRSALADYYVLVAARRGGLGPYGLLPAYREMVRGRMRADIMQYYWRACFRQGADIQLFVDCPPPENAADVNEIIKGLAADQAIIDALRYWADTQRMSVELASYDLGRAQALIDRVEALQ